MPETKNRRGRYLTLSDKAKALLLAMPDRQSSGWAFPSRIEGKALHNPRKAFARLLAAAGIEHLRTCLAIPS